MPASYPSATYSPAAKNTGDGVQAAHVNDLDAEVVAVETGLRTGLQHALTVSTGGLTVSTGNTILGQNLSVGGTSTFAGAVTLSSLVTAALQPRCLAYSSAAVSLAAGVFQVLSFESEEFNVGGLHSTGTNPSRLTVPTGAGGLYMVGATVRVAGAPTQCDLRLVKNSTVEVTTSAAIMPGAGTVSLALTSPLALAAGDFVEVEIVPSGSTASLPAGTVRRGMRDFWMYKAW